jgi:hypothetical protein
MQHGDVQIRPVGGGEGDSFPDAGDGMAVGTQGSDGPGGWMRSEPDRPRSQPDPERVAAGAGATLAVGDPDR